MKVVLTHISIAQRSINIACRCPHCGHNGTFRMIDSNDIEAHVQRESHVQPTLTHYIGMRKCPNTNCDGHLFFIADAARRLIYTYPTETIPFEKENIPTRILGAFEEAVKCHSNSCYIASAIMIRKTLEEICIERGATGGNLYQRLQDLGGKIVLPKELVEGMNELRLLGNDAAHIEAQTFNEIGKEEVEISLEFTKEILKATYQYENLLSKIRRLKKQP